MTASEFSFLALGLILGAVSGAALVELIRARPPAAREVRLTVAHDAIPRRSTTLADDAFVVAGPEPARGGPADRRLTDEVGAGFGMDRRTTVRFDGPTRPIPSGPAGSPYMAGAIPISPDPTAAPVPGRIMEPTMPLTDPPKVRSSGPDGRMVGLPISSGVDPVVGAFQAAVAAAAGAAQEPIRKPTATAVMDRPSAAASSSGGSSTASTPVATERCAEERRISDERCELATRARALADIAADASRAAQRGYDAHEAAAVTAAWRADPRAVHDAKEAAQGGFRSAVAAATTPEQHEAAARDWLNEINRINTEAREATGTAATEHAAAAEIGARLERLGLEADAARIGAENADAACLAARVAVAACEERTTSDASSFLVTPSSAAEPRLDDDERLGLALEAGGEPRIFRLLRGDRAAMTTLVGAIAGDDADARRRWQLLLTGLVEAIVADAIEAAALEFPQDHPFWGAFTRTQDRDIVQALASLGYRFDGLGGWTDDRHPSQRDLSLALGYAGLDPMRVRHGPNEEAMDELFRDVTVAADEYLAGIAGDLTLAEMVAMLGRRADGLAEIWNDWGRVRPLLLDET
ncbi:MAG: hypothetical protein QOI00_1915 [Chloroflexota bacterium]|nr:hypothetical protein [Chloroflexota bacterium]